MRLLRSVRKRRRASARRAGGPLLARRGRDLGDGGAVGVHVRVPAALGAEFALQGARMRIARAYLVAGQAEPALRDPRGGGFDPGDAAAFAAASAPSLPRGVPQGQRAFASRGG